LQQKREYAIRIKKDEEVLFVNKAELVASMAEKSGLTKKDAETALNAFMKSVEEALAKNDKVQLVGFGTFDVRERKERQGRNPRNPEQVIEIPASKAPVFKAGKALKDMVNA
jgi:DNA-binding protein HU-beta